MLILVDCEHCASFQKERVCYFRGINDEVSTVYENDTRTEVKMDEGMNVLQAHSTPNQRVCIWPLQVLTGCY